MNIIDDEFMNIDFDDVEYVPVPVRSIVSTDCPLLEHEIPPLVTYKGVTGLLLRRLSDDSLLDLTMTEWWECIKLNTPEDEELI